MSNIQAPTLSCFGSPSPWPCSGASAAPLSFRRQVVSRLPPLQAKVYLKLPNPTFLQVRIIKLPNPTFLQVRIVNPNMEVIGTLQKK